MDEHTPLTIVVFGATLGVLRLLELVLPMFERGPAGHARRNLSMAGVNGLAAGALAGLTVGAVGLAAANGWGVLRQLEAPPWVVLALALVLLDLWHYGFHVLAHKAPVLWRFHVVHHHDESVQASSALRFHVGEICVQHAMALPVYVLLGVGLGHVVLYELVLVPVAMFHHANVRIPERLDRVLRLVVVTPRMHWVHHSRWQPETDSNYSAVLSVWDRVFGTFRLRRDPGTIDFGIDGYDRSDCATLRGMLLTPFRPIKSEYGRPPPEEQLSSPGGGAAGGGNGSAPAGEAARGGRARGGGDAADKATPETGRTATSATTTLAACPKSDRA